VDFWLSLFNTALAWLIEAADLMVASAEQATALC
jgi:hypothetical protein